MELTINLFRKYAIGYCLVFLNIEKYSIKDYPILSIFGKELYLRGFGNIFKQNWVSGFWSYFWATFSRLLVGWLQKVVSFPRVGFRFFWKSTLFGVLGFPAECTLCFSVFRQPTKNWPTDKKNLCSRRIYPPLVTNFSKLLGIAMVGEKNTPGREGGRNSHDNVVHEW